MKRGVLGSSLLLVLLSGCASAPVDMTEPRRIVGTENAIRIDAQIAADHVAPGAQIPIKYEITNQRQTPIAIAELIPETSYDADTRLFTVSIGSEVPGNVMLPRLVEIAPGEKRVFNTSARVNQIMPPRNADPIVRAAPAGLRLKLNFLGDTQPFQQLIGIKETAVADAKLADELFNVWLERNEVVYTNAIPMRWAPRPRAEIGDPPERRAPGRRRGGG